MGGGGSLIFSYIRRFGLFYSRGGGFKISNFDILGGGGFRKMNILLGMKILWMFLGSSQNWAIIRGNFCVF